MRDFERGARVFVIGDAPDGLWGVATCGFALEFATSEYGSNFAHTFRPGTWFGEAEVFDRRPRLVTIIPTRQSLCLHLPLHALEAVAEVQPAVWRSVGILAGYQRRRCARRGDRQHDP